MKTALSVIISAVLIGVAILFVGNPSAVPAAGFFGGNNVNVIDGKQIVEVWAKGGYYPQKSIAKVGIPTIIRFNTSGTYDCSASVLIPSLGISEFLSPSGVTDIDLGSLESKTIQGTCGMGMYSFQVDFQN